MLLSDSITGYLLDGSAGRLAESTLAAYRIFLTHLSTYLHDPQIEAVTHDDLVRFMTWLRLDYRTEQGNPLSGSSLDNHWKAIRSLFRWSNEVLNTPRPDMRLPRPRYVTPEIDPFSEDEIKRILAALERNSYQNTTRTMPYTSKRPTASRDKMIVLILLDTGVRIGELARIEMQDIDLEAGEIYIRPFGTGRKTKARFVYLGKATKRLAWLYTVKQRKDAKPDDIFIGCGKDSIQHVFYRLRKKTGIHIYPHRFRHTFAIQFLRNGGDPFTLQHLLGHSTLDMTRRYVMLAKSDLKDGHRRASPVDNWRF